MNNSHIYRCEDPLNKLTLHSPKTLIIKFSRDYARDDLPAGKTYFAVVDHFYGNIVAGHFWSSSTTYYMFNMKTRAISNFSCDQRWPPLKIKMFLHNKCCFGIILNRGLAFHVFGIHLCKMVLFMQNQPFNAVHISGVIFLDHTTLLIYGERKFNMRYNIKLK